MKGAGGVVGLQQDKQLLQKWNSVAPELVRLIGEFEDSFYTSWNMNNEGNTAQLNFKKEVKETISTISRYGNPFLCETQDLITVDTHDCAVSTEAMNITKIHELGKTQYNNYVSNVLNKGTTSIHSTLKKNKFAIFQKRTTDIKKKSNMKE